ncbi:hypothetical protein ACHHYP_14046 [Achlya hypogyna]|uniref:START domain-containing protein n=1 Tax=Achlya hypogyna TaxID=1202772 RepID=A0A1V9YE69_ACHHY|nr:hypothetical protein ACHHYP_14046 [Achlya hypogyna]
MNHESPPSPTTSALDNDDGLLNFLVDVLPTFNDAPTTAQQRYRLRQKSELYRLRAQAAELGARLTLLRELRHFETAQCSFWERKARAQKLGCQKASQENSRLKGALQEQLTAMTKLRDLVLLTPRQMAYPSNDMVDWKLRKLSVAEETRHSCLQALLDDAYDRVDTLLLSRGLCDAPPGHKTLKVTTSSVISIEFEAVKRLAIPFENASANFWVSWNDARRHPSHVEILESIGSNTVYVKQTELLHGAVPYLHRLAAMKRYVEKDRVVFVIRTILDDEKHPVPDGLFMGDDTVIIVLERVNAWESCRRLCLLGTLPLDPPPKSPFASSPRRFLRDFITDEIRRTMDTVEILLD